MSHMGESCEKEEACHTAERELFHASERVMKDTKESRCAAEGESCCICKRNLKETGVSCHTGERESCHACERVVSH